MQGADCTDAVSIFNVIFRAGESVKMAAYFAGTNQCLTIDEVLRNV